jgi:hypothetical protein
LALKDVLARRYASASWGVAVILLEAVLTIHTTKMFIVVPEEFQLASMSKPAPEGMYEITLRHEKFEGLTYISNRVISATIYVPIAPGTLGVGTINEFTPDELLNLKRKAGYSLLC